MKASQVLTSRRLIGAQGIAALVLGVCGLFALGAGPDGVSWGFLLDDEARRMVLDVRAPRVLLSGVAGAALATAGAALQALLRNPLADPYVIGVSGGAAVGGALVLAAGPALQVFVPYGAVLGALGSSALLAWFVMRDRDRTDATILAGVVFNAFASAIITLLKVVLPAERTQALLFWLVGSIDYVPFSTLAVVGFVVAGGIGVLVAHAGDLELMALGEVEASTLR